MRAGLGLRRFPAGLAVRTERHPPGAGGADVLVERGQLLGDVVAADHEAQLGVQPRRARVHVHRADHGDAAVDHQRLAVQAGVRGAVVAEPGLRLAELPAQLVQLDAVLQQRHAVARIADVHRRRIGAGEGVGQHAQRDAVRVQLAHHGHAARTGHEVGRDHDHLAAGPAGQADQVVGQRLLGAGRRVAAGRGVADLARGVDQQAHRRPLERRQAAGLEVGGPGVADQVVAHLLGHRRIERRGARRRRDPRAGERLHRVGERVVPVAVERGRQRAHHRAGSQHIEVDEVARRAAQEVGVAEVAAAGDRDRVVGHQHLAVHAAVDARQLGERGQHARDGREASGRQGVVEPHLDPRHARERQQQWLLARGVEVVDQQPHAHAALGRGGAHALQQGTRRIIAAHEVVLQVQRALGAVDQRGQRVEGFGAVDQRPQAGALRVRRRLLHEPVERRARGRQGVRVRPLDRRRQAGTAGQREDAGHAGPAEPATVGRLGPRVRHRGGAQHGRQRGDGRLPSVRPRGAMRTSRSGRAAPEQPTCPPASHTHRE